MTKYLAMGMVVLALLCVTFFYRGQVFVAKYKGEVEKVAQRDATIKNKTETAALQRKADRKALEAQAAIIKDLLDSQPTCPPTTIVCEDGKCPVTIEPCESPW